MATTTEAVTKAWIRENLSSYRWMEYRVTKNGKGQRLREVLLKCPEPEHAPYWVVFSAVKRGARCGACAGRSRRVTLEDLFDWKRENEVLHLKLIDWRRDDGRLLIKFECASGHTSEIDWDNLKWRQRCNRCGDEARGDDWGEEKVVETFRSQGFAVEAPPRDRVWKRIARVTCSDIDGFWYEYSAHALIRGKPHWLNGNPFAIKNVRTYVTRHHPEYELLSTEYLNAGTKYRFRYLGKELSVDEDPVFERSWSKVTSRGLRHPKLHGASRGETVVEQVLRELDVPYEAQFRFPELRRYPFDFAIFLDRERRVPRLLIEYHGDQHFQAVDHFGGSEALRAAQERDQRKLSYASNAGIHLEVFHAGQSPGEIQEKLERHLGART